MCEKGNKSSNSQETTSLSHYRWLHVFANDRERRLTDNSTWTRETKKESMELSILLFQRKRTK